MSRNGEGIKMMNASITRNFVTSFVLALGASHCAAPVDPGHDQAAVQQPAAPPVTAATRNEELAALSTPHAAFATAVHQNFLYAAGGSRSTSGARHDFTEASFSPTFEYVDLDDPE